MPDPMKSGRQFRLSDEEVSARLARLGARFGERETPFYLNSPGDYAVGIVEEVSEFSHEEFGTSPQVTLKLEEGTSAESGVDETVSTETGEKVAGKSYVIRLFPKAVKGRALKPGDRIAVANYGNRRNKADTFDYQDIVLRILPPA